MRALLISALISPVLGACNQADREFAAVRIGGDARGVMTTADVRTVLERPDPMRPGRMVLCTEPPPDIAKAIAAAGAAALKADVAGEGGGSASASAARSERLAQLAGRVPGLLALRDGLFRACEAKANGMIGDEVYAMVVSQYGNLLTTVMLASGMRDPAPATQPPDPQPGAPDKPATPGAAASTTAQTDAAPGLLRDAVLLAAAPPDPPRRSPPTAADEQNRTDYNEPSALQQMQANYFNNLTSVGPLLVACLNEHDPSKPHPLDAAGARLVNPVLSGAFCGRLVGRLADAEIDAKRGALQVALLNAGARKGGR